MLASDILKRKKSALNFVTQINMLSRHAKLEKSDIVVRSIDFYKFETWKCFRIFSNWEPLAPYFKQKLRKVDTSDEIQRECL